MSDEPGCSGYKEPQPKRFLTTNEVLNALFEADSDSDVSEISFESETASSEEFLEVLPSFVDETHQLPEPCFRDTLLDADVSPFYTLFMGTVSPSISV